MTTPAATTEGSLVGAAGTQPEAAPVPAPAPEYVPFTSADLTPPEGFTLDDAAMGTLLEVMNNRELTPAQQAQSLLELQASLTAKSSEMGSQAWKDEQATWQAAVAADPVLGGTNLETTIAGIGNLMNRFGDDDVREAFDKTGAGNNPHVVRFLSTLVGQLKEPEPLPPGGPGNGGAPRSHADRIFGS